MRTTYQMRQELQHNHEAAKKEVDNEYFLVRRSAYRQIAKKQSQEAMLALKEGTKDKCKWVRIQCYRLLLDYYPQNKTALCTVAKGLRTENELMEHLKRIMRTKREVSDEMMKVMERISETNYNFDEKLDRLLTMM